MITECFRPPGEWRDTCTPNYPWRTRVTNSSNAVRGRKVGNTVNRAHGPKNAVVSGRTGTYGMPCRYWRVIVYRVGPSGSKTNMVYSGANISPARHTRTYIGKPVFRRVAWAVVLQHHRRSRPPARRKNADSCTAMLSSGIPYNRWNVFIVEGRLQERICFEPGPPCRPRTTHDLFFPAFALFPPSHSIALFPPPPGTTHSPTTPHLLLDQNAATPCRNTAVAQRAGPQTGGGFLSCKTDGYKTSSVCAASFASRDGNSISPPPPPKDAAVRPCPAQAHRSCVYRV